MDSADPIEDSSEFDDAADPDSGDEESSGDSSTEDSTDDDDDSGSASDGDTAGDDDDSVSGADDETADQESDDGEDSDDLQAAGQDADQSLDEGGVDDPVSTCPGEEAPSPAPAPGVTPPPPPVPGDLQITVKNGKTGNPIQDANVDVTGPEPNSGKTDGSGNLIYKGVQTGSYTANAKKDGFDPGSASGTVNPAALTKLEIDLSPQCWKDDYEKSIAVNSYGRYFRKYKSDGTEYSYNFQKKYKILVPVKTGSKITVEIRFKSEIQTGVTDADANAAKTKLENGLSTYWTGKFTLEADDPQCGKKSFSIEYKVVWVTSGQDYTIKIHNTYPREGLTGDTMNVSKTTSAWTYAHESAHCVGLPDEYSYSTNTETVKYIKPDGTLDAGISAPPNGKSKTAADATIMSAVDNTITLPRHAWNIAIEVQELLTAKLGRKITCTIT